MDSPKEMIDYKPIIEEINHENLIGVDIKDGSQNDVEEIFNYEKESPTMDKEIEEFRTYGKTEAEGESGFSFDDLGDSGGDIDFENSSDVEQLEDEEQDKGELEDFFDSAEFVIFVTELIIVFGTNFYLKYKGFSKITIDDFNKTKTQHKLLVKSWAKVLQKYDTKVSAEMELLFALGSAYGMKIQGILNSKEREHYEELKRRENEKKGIKIQPTKKRVNKNENKPPIINIDEEQENVFFEDKKEVKKDTKRKSNGIIDKM